MPLVLAGAVLGDVAAWAQQPAPPPSMPGLVVSMPPPSGGQSGPPPAMPGLIVSTPPPAAGAPPPGMPGAIMSAPSAPQPAAPASAAPKPKAKPTPRKVAGPDPAAAKPPQGIAALVNDEPITAFQVERLSRFMALSANIADRARANMKAIAEDPRTNDRLKEILQETIKANPGKTREQILAIFEERKKQFVLGLQKQAVEGARASVLPSLRKKALDELIEERLKHQEAKRLNISISDDEADRAFKGMAERNKLSLQEFMANIRAQGADPEVMKNRLRTQMVWREVIRRRFGHTIAVSNKEIDQLVSASAAGEDQVELQLHKITLPISGKIDQKIMAQRFAEAEGLRARFPGCKGTASLAKDSAAAKFEDLGFRKAGTLSEPTRSLLLQAKDGEMAPAALTAAGVELYAVCGRRVVKATEQKRQAAENELQMKEFERIAQRHLQDLRKDALIEIR